MCNYPYGFLFDLASDDSCCQPSRRRLAVSVVNVVNEVRRSEPVVRNHRPLCRRRQRPKLNRRQASFVSLYDILIMLVMRFGLVVTRWPRST